jgi:hypothetical protein
MKIDSKDFRVRPKKRVEHAAEDQLLHESIPETWFHRLQRLHQNSQLAP